MSNNITIEGNIASEIKVRDYTAGSGEAGTIVSFRVADNPPYPKDAEAVFWRCQAWNKTGDAVVRMAKKGTRVLIYGDVRDDSWETQEGERRTQVRVEIRNITFLDRLKPRDPEPDAPQIPAPETVEDDPPF